MSGAVLLLSCSRKAEIEETPDVQVVSMGAVPMPEGGVPVVTDANLAHPNGLTCAERPGQTACVGANDFPCDYGRWIQQLAVECQQQTDCRTDGWVEVLAGPDGCAAELRMEDPSAAYVECISEQLRLYRCPCLNVAGSTFLGIGHNGCNTCGTGEHRCPSGSTCRDGKCVEDNSAMGGSD